MTQIETSKSNSARHLTIDFRRHWWRTNYQVIRFGVVKPWNRILRFNMQSEGVIPDSRPILLVPVHRTSVDIFAISHVAREFVSYVSTDDFGHSRLANGFQKFMTSALGSIVWQHKGISNRRARALTLARDVEQRLDHRMIVAAFTQGEYQPHSVDSIEDGLVGLLKRYERRFYRDSGQELRIPIVPVGLDYDLNDSGLVFSNFGKRLADRLPLFPRWTVPACGSNITVRFGDPQYLDDRDPADVTESVMQQAAELSNIPYKAA